MGRAHEVRAKKMAATSAAKSALYMRASKEIYMAAKSGEPDPNSNLALRAVLEKYKGQGVTKEVIERAINKAKGGEVTAYEAGRYEGFGPGSSAIIVDTLTDKAFFPAPQEGDRRFESCGYLVLERDSKVYFYVGNPVFKKYIVNRPFETMCNNIQSYIDFGME